MYRSYNDKQDLKREDLVNSSEFYEDVTKFLRERNGVNKQLSPDEAYDEFMEHMRYHNVNEVTVLRDLEYVQNSDRESKANFGNLIDAFDKIDDGVTLAGIGDYITGTFTAPSTYIGLATGGTGKLASMAGTQVAKIGLRKLLAEARNSALKAAAVEGSIGFGQGLGQEAVRTDVGLQESITGERALTTGGLSALTAGVINFPTGICQAKKASRANELIALNELKAAEKASKASEKSAATIIRANETTDGASKIKQIRETLQALDPEKVRKGRNIKRMSSMSDSLEAGLPVETIENITAAALRIQDKDVLNIQPNERITSALARALSDGKFEKLDAVERILEEHNLNFETFSYVYLAEISDAGRKLQQQAQVSKAFKTKKIGADPQPEELITYQMKQSEVDSLLANVDQLSVAGKSAVDGDAAKVLTKNKEATRTFFQDLDRLRLGVMTSQPATTMRNNLNGGFRVAVDATTRVFDNLLSLRNPFDGTFDVAKHVLSPYEAMAVQKIFKETFPEEASKLFRQAADLEATYGKEGALAVLGRKVNVLNTMSDNIWKRAVLSASLSRRISDKNIKMTDEFRDELLMNKLTLIGGRSSATDTVEKAREGGAEAYEALLKEFGLGKTQRTKLNFHDLLELNKLGDIDDSIIKNSIEDAYEFVYQTSFKGENFFGKLAKGTIKAHQDMPFVVSGFMPFPRFVANQIKFIYQHTPLLGLLPLDKPIKGMSTKQYIREKLPKQMTGAMMFMVAYNWRLKQGETTNWYEFKDNNNNIVDGRPVYGPFSSFVLAADIIQRYQNGSMPATISPYIRDALQATLGSTFRAGMGLYSLDKLYTDLEGGEFEKAAGEAIANIINTFTLPASALRDVYAQFDEDVRGIPETRNGEYNFLDVLWSRATRSLPKNFAGEFGDISLQDATRARSPFETGELTQVNPLEKQMFGLTKRKPKNLLLQEMARVGLRPYDLYRRDRNERRDLYIRQVLSEADGPYNLNEKLGELIRSERYQKLGNSDESKAIKRDMLDSAAQIIVETARELADQRIETEAFDTRASYTSNDRESWNRVPAIDKARIDAEYQRDYGGDTVSGDRDKTIYINGEPMNVLRWGIERAKSIRGTKGIAD